MRRARHLDLCSGCGGPRDRPGQRYCKACHRAYMRGWRKARGSTAETINRLQKEIDLLKKFIRSKGLDVPRFTQ